MFNLPSLLIAAGPRVGRRFWPCLSLGPSGRMPYPRATTGSPPPPPRRSPPVASGSGGPCARRGWVLRPRHEWPSIAPFDAAYQVNSPGEPSVAAADERLTMAPPWPPCTVDI